MSIPLNSFAVSLAETASLVWVQDAPEEAPRWSMRELEPDEGYAGCTATKFQPVDFRRLSWP